MRIVYHLGAHFTDEERLLKSLLIEAEFFLAIRNPATFLLMLLQRIEDKTYDDFIGATDLFTLRWSETLERIMKLSPGVPLTVWCDEDTPLIWPEVLRAVADLPEDVALRGDDDLLATLMAPEGLTRLQGYLANHPPGSVAQRRKIVTAFLEKFALPERLEAEVEMPGWTQEVVDALSQLYAQDVARIAQMPGVRFIAP